MKGSEKRDASVMTGRGTPLSGADRRRLRARAHRLKPVVIVGASGLTEAVRAEVDRALSDHVIIKVRVNAGDRRRRRELIGALCSGCDAELVQTIGHVAVLFREPEE